jgi:hypothetical protein
LNTSLLLVAAVEEQKVQAAEALAAGLRLL